MSSHKKLSEVLYKGPKKTLTQLLTTDEIKDLLDGYEITVFENLKLFYNVRYYSKNPKSGEVLFRTGGSIIHIDNEKEYVILSSGSLSWSVQKLNTIFYQALPLSVIKEQIEMKYIDDLEKKDNEILELTTYSKKLIDTVNNLTIENTKLLQNIKMLEKTKSKIVLKQKK
jgi:hypothetical protein